MFAELDTTLLAIVGSMIATGVAVLRWLMSRNDRMWEWMKKEEEEVHAKILESLDSITKTQLEIIQLLKERPAA